MKGAFQEANNQQEGRNKLNLDFVNDAKCLYNQQTMVVYYFKPVDGEDRIFKKQSFQKKAGSEKKIKHGKSYINKKHQVRCKNKSKYIKNHNKYKWTASDN